VASRYGRHGSIVEGRGPSRQSSGDMLSPTASSFSFGSSPPSRFFSPPPPSQPVVPPVSKDIFDEFDMLANSRHNSLSSRTNPVITPTTATTITSPGSYPSPPSYQQALQQPLQPTEPLRPLQPIQPLQPIPSPFSVSPPAQVLYPNPGTNSQPGMGFQPQYSNPTPFPAATSPTGSAPYLSSQPLYPQPYPMSGFPPTSAATSPPNNLTYPQMYPQSHQVMTGYPYQYPNLAAGARPPQ